MTVKLSRRAVLGGALATALPYRAVANCGFAPPQQLQAGVNLAGGEFGTLLGRYGRDYLYPTSSNFDYYAGLGFKLVRIPFKWERLQPQIGQAFAEREERLLSRAIRDARAHALTVVIDVHNYAKRRLESDAWSTEHLIGSSQLPGAAFEDLWRRLAIAFAGDPGIVFGLMNEPTEISAKPWLSFVNGVLGAIRGTGARNLVLVPGVNYSGAHSWLRSGNAVFADVADPGKNFALEVHQYFDADSSGTHPEAVSGTIGSERIASFQRWARQNGLRAFLGEFNGPRTPAGLNAISDICQEMSANADVWLGWAAWAGGRRWPEQSMFNLEPWNDGREREQTRILARQATRTDGWVSAGSSLDGDLARGRLHGAPTFDAVIADVGTVCRPGALDLQSGRKLTDHLLSDLNAPAFTIVLGVNDTTIIPAGTELLSFNNAPALCVDEKGALMTSIVQLQTSDQSADTWRAMRRVALSVDRQERRIALGVTGAASLETSGSCPTCEKASLGPATAVLTRITSYRHFFDHAALDTILA